MAIFVAENFRLEEKYENHLVIKLVMVSKRKLN